MPPVQPSPVIVAAQLPPPVTGLSAVNRQVLEGLRGRGGRVTVTDLSPPASVPRAVQLLGRLGRTLSAAVTLLRYRSGSPLAFYMPVDGGAGIAFNILLALAARALGYRLFMHHHSFAYVNRRSALMDVLVRAAPRGAVHVVLCEDMGGRLKAQYASAWKQADAESFVLSNGFMLPEIRIDAAPARHGELRLGHLSNLTASKGAITFVELFEALRAEGLNVTAHIAGPTSEPQVERALAAAAARHGDRFQWLGAVYGDEKARFFSDIDAFVFPTTYENEAQPLVLLEALAQGAPILTIARGCIDCDYDDAVGLVARNAESFLPEATAWARRALEDPEHLRRGRANALAAAEAQRTLAVNHLHQLIARMTGPMV